MTNPNSSLVRLLYELKSTVELLIQFGGDSITSKYGAIERLRTPILAILSHQLKQSNNDIYEQLWQVIVRLSPNSERYLRLLQECFHQENVRLSVEQWIDQSVIDQCLSDQLLSLLNNSSLLNQYYTKNCFFGFEQLSEGFLLCLRTIERSDPSLLGGIDPKLFVDEFFQTNRKIENSSKIAEQEKEEKPKIRTKNEIFGHRRIQSDPLFVRSKEKNLDEIFPIKTDFESIDDRSQENSFSLLSTERKSKEKIFDSTSNFGQKGQKLEDFIRESDLKTGTELQKENAHFYFSEAILSAIEQTKFRFQCQKEFGQSFSSNGFFVSPGETTENSSSPSDPNSPSAHRSFLSDSNFLVKSSFENPDGSPKIQLVNSNFLVKSSINDSSFSLRPLDDSLRENLDSVEPPNTFFLSQRSSNFEDSSADSIALNLIETWKNVRSTNFDEFLWIVEENIEFQPTLLPMPSGVSIDPDGDSFTIFNGKKISHRGNDEWAPPREQIIIRIHPSVNRETKLKEQKFRCAGCGRHVGKRFSNSFLYCEYTDKFFCKTCHSKNRTFLPGYIILKWDFSTKHYVSNFAFDYLNRIRSEPVFNLHDLNEKLFDKNRNLKKVDILRWSLYYFDQYISHCRLAKENGDEQIFRKISKHLYNNPYIFSIDDLIQIKSGELLKTLEIVVAQLRDHVLNCTICSGQGHICQICRKSSDIIFPFDLEKNSVCPVCQSCFHLKCYENQKYFCPKCPRQQSRRNLIYSNQTETNKKTSSQNLDNEDDVDS